MKECDTMPILFLIVAGVTLSIVLSKRKRRKRTGAARTRAVRTVYTISARSQNAKTPEQLRRDAERSRKERFKRYQAEQDIIHYRQVKRDLLTAYNVCGALSGDSEKAIRKRIQYDNAIRKTEKQIEKAMFDARRTG